MIRAGALDREVTIQRHTEIVNEGGGVEHVWTAIATMRAEKVVQSLDELNAEFGETPSDTLSLKTRWHPSITTKDRLLFEGSIYDIDSVEEMGRQRGLFFRAKVVP